MTFTCLLAGCAMPPATEGVAGDDVAKAGEPAQAGAPTGLLPLTPQLTVPAGAPPRSNVPSVRYDLAVSGSEGLSPADGVPGDDGGGEVFERGGASWYGIQFHQRRTANGERFDMTAMTAAHKTLPFNTRVCVRSLVNGSEVLVRVNDRGPYTQGRVIDLSQAAADRIGLTGLGIKQVALTVIDHDGMRCGGLDVEPGDARAPAATDFQVAPAVPARRRAPAPRRRR